MDGVGNLSRCSDAGHRHARDHTRGAVRLAGRGMNLGVGDAGRDGIDANAVGRELLGKAEGERFNGGLRCRLVNVLVRRAERRGD